MKKAVFALTFAAVMSQVLFAGCSSSSSNDPAVDITPPPVPSGLRINAIGNGSVSLAWDDVSDDGLEGYFVYWRGEAPIDTLHANKQRVNETTTTITGLDYSTLYYFAVSAYDTSDNESALSVDVSGIPHNTTGPANPAGLEIVASNIEFPKVTLYWAENQEPDIALYSVYRSTTVDGLSDSLEAFVTTTTESNFTDIDVEVGTTYYYTVTCSDKGGWESPAATAVADMVLDKVTLESPVNYAYTGTNPTFTWEDLPGANSYNIVLTSTRIGNEIWNREVDGDTTQITYTGSTKLISGNTYYWRVGSISREEINSVSDVEAFVVRVQ